MLAQELQICTQQYEMPIDIKLLISSSSARVSSVILILDGKLAIYIDSREEDGRRRRTPISFQFVDRFRRFVRLRMF